MAGAAEQAALPKLGLPHYGVEMVLVVSLGTGGKFAVSGDEAYSVTQRRPEIPAALLPYSSTGPISPFDTTMSDASARFPARLSRKSTGPVSPS